MLVKADLLLALGVVGGRTAFEVDGAVGDQRNAGRRRHRIELDLELVELELLLHGIDDLVADVHRVADRLLVVVEIGERNRQIAIAERDRAGFLDILQRPRELLGIRLATEERHGERIAKNTCAIHRYSPHTQAFPAIPTLATERYLRSVPILWSEHPVVARRPWRLRPAAPLRHARCDAAEVTLMVISVTRLRTQTNVR